MKLPFLPRATRLMATPPAAVWTDPVAVNAINALGIDLLHQTATADANALLSPYSIQMAMALAYAGAEGGTREEMARVLHYPTDEARLTGAFTALQVDLAGIMQRQAVQAELMTRHGIPNDRLILTTANRLFGQTGSDFRPGFLALLKDQYQAPLEALDFIRNASGATGHINSWVENRTHGRLRDLIPPGALDMYTRLVVVNAIYLKAPWATKFSEEATQPRSFRMAARKEVKVPTMFLNHSLGYARRDGCSAVVIPYAGTELQLLVLLPDRADGLAVLEAGLKPETLADGASAPSQNVNLYLPKFKIEPPAMSLAGSMQRLGMKNAFDVPENSANFDRMAPRRLEDYLYISDIFHKTFLKLDELGTEAAAATAVAMPAFGMVGMAPLPPPVEIHVDHPFLFAVQHRASGACLFLGQVTDPR